MVTILDRYYITDRDGDEIDNKDECIVTSDMKLITDQLKLFYKMFQNSKLFCLIDACHSAHDGSTYKYKSSNNSWITKNLHLSVLILSHYQDAETIRQVQMHGYVVSGVGYMLHYLVAKMR